MNIKPVGGSGDDLLSYIYNAEEQERTEQRAEIMKLNAPLSDDIKALEDKDDKRVVPGLKRLRRQFSVDARRLEEIQEEEEKLRRTRSASSTAQAVKRGPDPLQKLEDEEDRITKKLKAEVAEEVKDLKALAAKDTDENGANRLGNRGSIFQKTIVDIETEFKEIVQDRDDSGVKPPPAL